MSTLPISYSGYNNMNSMTGLPVQSTGARSGLASMASSFNGSKTEIRAQIDELLTGIPKGDDGKLSFKDIEVYREKMEKEWDDAVKADLKKLGVDVEKEMPLSWDAASGKLTVQKGHPDKEVIDNYFASNSDKIEDFQRIIKLGKMTASHTQKLQPSEIIRNIQRESIAWWYEDNSDPTSWFSGGGRIMGSSQSSYQGLNLKV